MASMLETMPYMLPIVKDGKCTYYAGFINVMEQSFRLSVTSPCDGDVSKAVIECDWKLDSLIRNQKLQIQERLMESKSLPAFLKSFTEIVERCIKETVCIQKPWTNLSQNILQQLQDIGWKKVVGLSEDFSWVQIGCYDKRQRLHKLKVMFQTENYEAQPCCVTDLPQTFDFQWSSVGRLKDLIAQFEASLDRFQDFWDCVEEIDQKTWVLEPEHPTYSCTYRRIALGQNLSLHIVINLLQPSSLPECRILGAETVVVPLREKLNLNLHHWDLDRSLLNNLQEVLEVDFPSPSDLDKEELTVDCGICYCHQLEEEIPDIICQHLQCSQAFHYSCLYEWLRNSCCRQSFNYIFGECPFCSKPMRVKIRME